MSEPHDRAYRDVAAGAKVRIGHGAGRRVVVTIGIDRYAEWPILRNAVNDATGAHALFLALGFEEVVPPILDGAATGRAPRKLVTDVLSKLESSDSLVLFFVGHGHTHTRRFEDGVKSKTGYLIPVDGHSPAHRQF